MKLTIFINIQDFSRVIFVFVFFSLLTQSRTKRAQTAQEMRDREEVEKELSVVKAWIQETRELLLNPTPDLDSLLQELEVYLMSQHRNIMFLIFQSFEYYYF